MHYTPRFLRTAITGSIRNGFPNGFRMAVRQYGDYRVRVTPQYRLRT